MKVWQDYVAQADFYRAIGYTDLFLDNVATPPHELPWQYVARVEGTLELDESQMFTAAHPCGLTFRWTVRLVTLQDTDGVAEYVTNEVALSCLRQVCNATALLRLRAVLQTLHHLLRDREREYRLRARLWHAARRTFAKRYRRYSGYGTAMALTLGRWERVDD